MEEDDKGVSEDGLFNDKFIGSKTGPKGAMSSLMPGRSPQDSSGPRPSDGIEFGEMPEEELSQTEYDWIKEEFPNDPGFYWVSSNHGGETSIAWIDVNDHRRTIDLFGDVMSATQYGIAKIERFSDTHTVLCPVDMTITRPEGEDEEPESEFAGMF